MLSLRCGSGTGRGVQECPGRVVACPVVEGAGDHVDLFRTGRVDVAARPGGTRVHLQHVGLRAGRSLHNGRSRIPGKSSRTGDSSTELEM
jgi:hypothetical protein